MEILKEEQFIIIPRLQYEKMEEIVNEKKDIHVRFNVVFNRRFKEQSFENLIHSYTSCHELNKNFDQIQADAVCSLIDNAVKEVSEINEREINFLRNKIISIESKWWYRLLNRFKNEAKNIKQNF
jgi:flagellar biosynthesis/type III secretory pathway chaperone